MTERIAVVLFNLGAPDSSAAVEPFLFNLFHDRAILDLPQPLRYAAAKWIAHRRAPAFFPVGPETPAADQRAGRRELAGAAALLLGADTRRSAIQALLLAAQRSQVLHEGFIEAARLLEATYYR